MKKISLLLTSFAFVACGAIASITDAIESLADLDLDELIAIAVEVEGKAAADGTKSAISSAVADVSNVPSNGGSNIAGEIQPNPEVFNDANPDFAPGYISQNDANGTVSGWDGPLTGPDGQDSWYRRTWTVDRTQYDPDTQMQVTNTVSYHYWFKTVPAHDFVEGGWYNFKGDNIQYAWSTDDPVWNDSEDQTFWHMNIDFRQPQELAGGGQLPGAAVGTWIWRVHESASYGGGSKADGSFEYYIGNGDHHWFGSDTFVEEVSAAEVGKTLAWAFKGRSRSTYNYESKYQVTEYDQDTFQSTVVTKTTKYFGGHEGTNEFVGEVTKQSETNGDFRFQFSGESRSYHGQGAKDENVDYFTQPEYSAETTPPGDLWAISSYTANSNPDLEERDGLLGWSTWEYWGDWKGTDVPLQAEDDNFDEDKITINSYNRSIYLNANGGESEPSVYCSSQDVADDCPAIEDDPSAEVQ